MFANAIIAIRLAIGDTSGTIVHESVGGQNQFYLPVSVSSVEKKLFKASVLLHILLLNQDAAFVLHIPGGAAWVLIVVAVVLNCETGGWDDPISTDGHFFGVVAGPDLDSANIIIRKTFFLHGIIEVLSVLVATVVAFKEAGLSTNKNFKVGHEIGGQVTTTKVSLQLAKNGSEGIRLNVLGSIDSETTEADTDQVSKVSSDSLTNIIRLSIKISKTR